jgi:all-trans-8'-apo-beta-carotenal 15,15'-oxygenase
MVQTASPTFSREDWQKGYESLRTETSYWIDDIEGEIPSVLEGTLFRNGPGQLDINGQKYGHPFDGDGMVCAIAFKAGKAHFKKHLSLLLSRRQAKFYIGACLAHKRLGAG